MRGAVLQYCTQSTRWWSSKKTVSAEQLQTGGMELPWRSRFAL